MSDQKPSVQNSAGPAQLGRVRGYAVAFTAGLLIAALPLSIVAFRSSQHQGVLNRELRAANLELSLARAAVLSRNGDYAAARDVTSEFFTAARMEVDSQSDVLDAAQTGALKSALSERDSIITLLARSDPASAERLSQLYLSYRAAIGGR